MKITHLSGAPIIQWPTGLTEECWLERERPGYWKRFFPYLENPNIGLSEHIESANVFYCLYHENGERIRVIDFTCSNESALNRLPPSLRTIMETCPPVSWGRFLSLFRIHQCLVWDAIHNVDSRFTAVEDVVAHTWSSVPIVDHILDESFGVLLWQHQYESLFRMVEHGHSSEIMKFYRDCHRGKPGVEEILSRSIQGDTTLGSVISERMIFDGIGHRDDMIREMALLAAFLWPDKSTSQHKPSTP